MTLSHIIEIAGQIFWPLMLLFFLINRKFRTIIIHFFFMQPILLLSLAIYTVKIMIEMIWFISYDLWKGNFDVSRFINLFGVEITTIFFLSTLHMFVLYFVKKFMKEKPIPINFLKWFIHDGLSELNSLSTIDDELHPPIISKELSNFCLVFPHGIWPYSFSLSVFNRYPKNAGYAFCAGILLKVPLLTLFLSILCNFSIKSVSKKSIVDYLTNKIYHNKISIIYLGEIADQMLTAPGVNGINMCGHKGFLRLCLKHGCNLNIAYYFNGENMYTAILFNKISIFLPSSIRYALNNFAMWFNIKPQNVKVTGYHKHFITLYPKEVVTEEDVDKLYNDIVNFTFDIVKNNLHLTNSKLIKVN